MRYAAVQLPCCGGWWASGSLRVPKGALRSSPHGVTSHTILPTMGLVYAFCTGAMVNLVPVHSRVKDW